MLVEGPINIQFRLAPLEIQSSCKRTSDVIFFIARFGNPTLKNARLKSFAFPNRNNSSIQWPFAVFAPLQMPLRWPNTK